MPLEVEAMKLLKLDEQGKILEPSPAKRGQSRKVVLVVCESSAFRVSLVHFVSLVLFVCLHRFLCVFSAFLCVACKMWLSKGSASYACIQCFLCVSVLSVRF